MTYRSFSMALLAGLTLLGCSTAPISSAPQPAASPTIAASPEPTQSPIAPEPEQPKTPIAPANPPQSPASPQPSVPEFQGKAISSLSADWNGDGVKDRALLVESKTDPIYADLLIYLSQSPTQTKPVIDQKGIAWRGAMAGTQPSLSLNPQGSLVIESQNEAVGRDRWNKKITAMYDNGSFIVAGYTYSYRDTLDLAVNGTCDVNFLTRKGVKNDKAFTISTQPVNLADWTEKNEPKECQN